MKNKSGSMKGTEATLAPTRPDDAGTAPSDALALPRELDGFVFERDLSIGDGQGFVGTFVGWGTPRDFADDKTGDVRSVKVARFEIDACPGCVFSLLCGDKLVRLLADVGEGERVAVKNLGLVETKRGHRMRDWAVGREAMRKPTTKGKV